MTGNDDIGDFGAAPASDDASDQTRIGLAIDAVCKNGVEAALREMMDHEELLAIDVEFVDLEGNSTFLSDRGPEADTPEPENDPALHELRKGLADAWLRHVSLARSLGERGTYQQYVDACRREGMAPIGTRP